MGWGRVRKKKITKHRRTSWLEKFRTNLLVTLADDAKVVGCRLR